MKLDTVFLINFRFLQKYIYLLINSAYFNASAGPNFWVSAWKEIFILVFALLFILQVLFKKIPFPKLDWLDFFIIFFFLEKNLFKK